MDEEPCRLRDEGTDVLEQSFDVLDSLESQDKLAADQYLQRHHADAPEVPVLAPLPRARIDVELLIVVWHESIWSIEDRLSVEGQSTDVDERHLLADLVDEDGRWVQQSACDLGLDELGVHVDELLDDPVASSRHGPSLRQHVPEAVLLAGQLDVESVVRDQEVLEMGNVLVLPLDRLLRQSQRLDDLMWERLIHHVLGCSP